MDHILPTLSLDDRAERGLTRLLKTSLTDLSPEDYLMTRLNDIIESAAKEDDKEIISQLTPEQIADVIALVEANKTNPPIKVK